MDDGYRWWPWLLANWSRLALFAAIVALASLPLFLDDDNRPLLLASALLPLYMIHQYEEHAHGRFVAFFNATVGQGLPVLTVVSVFWINILLVWLLFLVSLYLARFVDPGLALIPVYTVIINALIHVATAAALRRYNPGLYTSLLLFLPAGLALLVDLNRTIDSRLIFNSIGVLLAIAGHAAIMGYATKRRARLAAGR